MTITGYQKRILEAAPEVGKNKAERLAIKLVKRQERMQEQFDFDESSLVIGVDVLVRSVLALASR